MSRNPGVFARLSLLLALGIAPVGAAQAQEEWKIGSPAVPGSLLGSQVTKAIAAIDKASGGRIKAEHQLITNEQDLMQQTLRGRLPMMHITIGGQSAVFPEVSALTLPYVWSSPEERDWVYENHVHQLVKDLYAAKGLTILRWADVGATDLFCRFPCKDFESLKGKKFRSSPSPADKIFLTVLGTNTQTMPLSDFFPAMQQGVVDGGHTSFAWYATTPLAQSAPHVLRSRHLNQLFYFVVRSDVWSKLGPEMRKAIGDGMPTTAELNNDMKVGEDAIAKQHIAKGGTITQPDAGQRQKVIALVTAAHGEMLATLPAEAKKIYAAIQHGKAEFAKRK
jgi:TRAP-type C4-dicarboxylate transport system substrate-binding protein